MWYTEVSLLGFTSYITGSHTNYLCSHPCSAAHHSGCKFSSLTLPNRYSILLPFGASAVWVPALCAAVVVLGAGIKRKQSQTSQSRLLRGCNPRARSQAACRASLWWATCTEGRIAGEWDLALTSGARSCTWNPPRREPTSAWMQPVNVPWRGRDPGCWMEKLTHFCVL